MSDMMTKQAAPKSPWEIQREQMSKQLATQQAQRLQQQKQDYAQRRQTQTAEWDRLSKAPEPAPLQQQLASTTRSGGAYAIPDVTDVKMGRARLTLPKLSEHDDAYMNRWLEVYNEAYKQNVTLDQLKQRLSGAYASGRQDFQQVQKESERGWYNPSRWTWLGGNQYDLSHMSRRLNRKQNRSVVDFRGDPIAYAESIERQNALVGKSSTYMSAKPYQQVAAGSSTAGQQLLRQGEDWGRRGEAAQYIVGRGVNGLTFGVGGNLAVGLGNKVFGTGRWKNINDVYGDYATHARNDLGDMYGDQWAKYVRRMGTGAELTGTALSTIATGGLKPSAGLASRFIHSARVMRPIELGSGAVADWLAEHGYGKLSIAPRIVQSIAHTSPYLALGGGVLSKVAPWLLRAPGAATAYNTVMNWANTSSWGGHGASALRQFVGTPLLAAAKAVVRNVPTQLSFAMGNTLDTMAQGRMPEKPDMESVKSTLPWLLGSKVGYAAMAYNMVPSMLAGKYVPFAIWAGAPQYDENGNPLKETYAQRVEQRFNSLVNDPTAKADFLKRWGMSPDASEQDIRKQYDYEMGLNRQLDAEWRAKTSMLPDSVLNNMGSLREEDIEPFRQQLDKLWDSATPEQRDEALSRVYRSEVMAGGPLPPGAFNNEDLSAQAKEDNLAIALGVADKEVAGTGTMHQLWDMTAGDKTSIALRAMDASPEARSAVIDYAGGLIRDAVYGKFAPEEVGKAREKYAAVLNKMTSEERSRMFETLLMDKRTTGKKLADIMRNAGAYGVDAPEMRKAAAKAIAQRMTNVGEDKERGIAGGGDFAAEFLPEFTAMLKSGQGITPEDKKMFAETLAELPEEAAGNLFFTANDDNFKKLARLFMSDEGKGILDTLPEEKRNAIKAQWETAAKARTIKAIQDNPIKNLPLAARLFAEKMGWGDGVADFLGSTGGFYGILALLLTGGVWLGKSLLSGKEESQQGQSLMDVMNAQRAQLARMTFGGMNG